MQIYNYKVLNSIQTKLIKLRIANQDKKLKNNTNQEQFPPFSGFGFDWIQIKNKLKKSKKN